MRRARDVGAAARRRGSRGECGIRALVAVALGIGLAPATPAWADYEAPRTIRFYGYFDMEAEVGTASPAARRWTFDQHHLNFLSTCTLDDRFRVLTKVEYEHGPFHDDTPTGTIYLPKAYLEYVARDELRVRAGLFLTPFGIYNERHDATPTFVSTVLPRSIYAKRRNVAGTSERFFAKLGTGVQVTGRVALGEWRGAYAVYVINGRGDTPAERDDNADKGTGVRLGAESPAGSWRVGLSAYRDRDGNALGTRRSAVAVDAAWESARWLVESEWIRPSDERIGPGGTPDGRFRRGFGGYVQAARRITRHLRPFARWERFDPDTDAGGDAETWLTAGINVPVSDAVVLKAEAHHVDFEDATMNDYEVYVASLAVVFR